MRAHFSAAHFVNAIGPLIDHLPLHPAVTGRHSSAHRVLHPGHPPLGLRGARRAGPSSERAPLLLLLLPPTRVLLLRFSLLCRSDKADGKESLSDVSCSRHCASKPSPLLFCLVRCAGGLHPDLLSSVARRDVFCIKARRGGTCRTRAEWRSACTLRSYFSEVCVSSKIT